MEKFTTHTDLFGMVAVSIWIRNEGPFIAWMLILFWGGGCLFLIYIILEERVRRRPYLITDKSVTINGVFNKTWEVYFTDVTSFSLIKINSAKMIGIKYKEHVDFRKIEESNAIEKFFRKMNLNIANTQETIQAYRLTMNQQQLLDLLKKDWKFRKKTTQTLVYEKTSKKACPYSWQLY